MSARLVSLLLALLMLQAVPAPPEGAPASGGLSQEDAAAFLCESGLLDCSGAGFAPEQPMTRAMLAGFLYRHAGSPALPSPRAFTDLPPEDGRALPAAWVWEAGLMDCGGEFGPDGPVCLEELRCALARYAGVPEEERAAWALPGMEELPDGTSLTQGQAAVVLAWFCLEEMPGP